jgi:alanine racemase
MINCAIIDLSAVAYNLRQVKKLVGPRTRIMGIVKSDAYGHGLVPVAKTLEQSQVDCLGVAHLQEAIQLRKNGVRLPVIVMCGVQGRDESRLAVEKDLTPVIFDLTGAETLDQESLRMGSKTPVHLKIDTGMGRLGIPHTEAGPFIQRIKTFEHLYPEALTSHLSSAHEKESEFTEKQIKNFSDAIETGRSLGLGLPLNNLANSAGIMAHETSHFSMVRPGIMLYGGLPSRDFTLPVRLRPAMAFKAQILQVRDLPDQTPISYGRTYYTRGPRRLAIISAGYGDGLPRSMSNLGSVLLRGKKVPIVGTICMNLTICDTTDIGEIRPGEEVIFLGSQGEETITGEDIAKQAGTISYEIFCSIGQRNKKEYLS